MKDQIWTWTSTLVENKKHVSTIMQKSIMQIKSALCCFSSLSRDSMIYEVYFSHQTVGGPRPGAARSTVLITAITGWASFASLRTLLCAVQLCHWKWDGDRVRAVWLCAVTLNDQYSQSYYFWWWDFGENVLELVQLLKLTGLAVLRTGCPARTVEATWITFLTCKNNRGIIPQSTSS